MNFTLADIHDEAVEREWASLVEEDVRHLLDHSHEFVDYNCVACGGTKSDPVFRHQGLSYRRCGDCRLLFISPGPDEALHLKYVQSSLAHSFWREHMPASVRKSRMIMYQERADFILSACAKHGVPIHSAVEVGAGQGELAAALMQERRAPIERLVLVEPQPLALEHIERRGRA